MVQQSKQTEACGHGATTLMDNLGTEALMEAAIFFSRGHIVKNYG